VAGVAATPAAASISYSVTATIGVGTWATGVGVDPVTGTVYVANENGTMSVIDESTGTVTATIGAGSGQSEGVAVDSVTGTVYVANNDTFDGNVAVIDGPPTPSPPPSASAEARMAWGWTRPPTPSTWPTTATRPAPPTAPSR